MDAMVGLMEGKQFITGVYSSKISIESLVLWLISYYILTCEMEMQVVTVQRL